MKKVNLTILGSLLAIGGLITSCKKTPPLQNLSSDFVVMTKYDTSAHPGSFKTFAIRDTITVVTENPKDSIWYDANAKTIINEVVEQMQAAGYSRVPVGSHSADLAVQVAGIRNVTLYGLVPGFWWGTAGYPDPCYWGGCYPYYYPYWYTYAVKTGTMIVEIGDLKNAAKNKKITMMWTGIAGGQIGNSTSFIVDQCVKSIDQAFKQSPFKTTE